MQQTQAQTAAIVQQAVLSFVSHESRMAAASVLQQAARGYVQVDPEVLAAGVLQHSVRSYQQQEQAAQRVQASERGRSARNDQALERQAVTLALEHAKKRAYLAKQAFELHEQAEAQELAAAALQAAVRSRVVHARIAVEEAATDEAAAKADPKVEAVVLLQSTMRKRKAARELAEAEVAEQEAAALLQKAVRRKSRAKVLTLDERLEVSGRPVAKKKSPTTPVAKKKTTLPTGQLPRGGSEKGRSAGKVASSPPRQSTEAAELALELYRTQVIHFALCRPTLSRPVWFQILRHLLCYLITVRPIPSLSTPYRRTSRLTCGALALRSLRGTHRQSGMRPRRCATSWVPSTAPRP